MALDMEIICKPCRKCELMQERLQAVISSMQQQKRVKINYSLKHTNDIGDAVRLGYGFSDLPILIINGRVEFAGLVKEEYLIRMKLEEVLRNT